MKKEPKTKRIKSTILILLMICLSSFPAFAASPTLLECDINNDGIINTLDLIEMSNHMASIGTPGWIKEDVDNNGVVQVCDLMFVANNYGATVNQNDMARIQKLSIAYGDDIGDTACQNFIANHFDMLDCPSSQTDGCSKYKSFKLQDKNSWVL